MQIQLPPGPAAHSGLMWIYSYTQQKCVEFHHVTDREPGARDTESKPQTLSSNSSVYCSVSFGVFSLSKIWDRQGRYSPCTNWEIKVQISNVLSLPAQKLFSDRFRNVTDQLQVQYQCYQLTDKDPIWDLLQGTMWEKKHLALWDVPGKKRDPRSNDSVKCCLLALTSPEDSQFTLMHWGLWEVLQ